MFSARALADGNYTDTLRLEAVKGNWSSTKNIAFLSDTPVIFTSPFPPSPVALFKYSPEKPVVNEQIIFNASESYSPKGNITSFEWNFNSDNVTIVTEPITNHTYNQPGKYSVTLKVTDNDTLWNTATQIITVH